MNPRISEVTPTDDYKLKIVFTNGEEGTYDCSGLVGLMAKTSVQIHFTLIRKKKCLTRKSSRRKKRVADFAVIAPRDNHE